MLKTVIDTTDGLDEAILPFYVESDGKFVLQIEGVDAHPDVLALKGAYERVKTDKATATQQAKALQTQIDAMAKDKPDEAAVLKLRQELEAERDKWKGEAEALSQRLTGVTRDRTLQEALTAAGVTNPAFLKAATAMMSGSVKMDGDAVIVETDMGPTPVGDYIKRWVAGEGAAFVAAPQGGGAKGGDGSKVKPSGDMGGTKADRVSALKNRFPDIE